MKRHRGRARAHQLTAFEFILPDKLAEEFQAAAKWHNLTTDELCGRLVRQYLADRRKAVVVGLPPELAMVAEVRSAIVTDWSSVRTHARKGCFSRAARTFIRALLTDRGVKISVRTLYYWERKFRSLGPAGLIDHRRWKPYARPASRGRQPNAKSAIKGTSKGV